MFGFHGKGWVQVEQVDPVRQRVARARLGTSGGFVPFFYVRAQGRENQRGCLPGAAGPVKENGFLDENV
jgi:hypothetical protein